LCVALGVRPCVYWCVYCGCVWMCVCVCVRACVRTCVRVCLHICAGLRACFGAVALEGTPGPKSSISCLVLRRSHGIVTSSTPPPTTHCWFVRTRLSLKREWSRGMLPCCSVLFFAVLCCSVLFCAVLCWADLACGVVWSWCSDLRGNLRGPLLWAVVACCAELHWSGASARILAPNVQRIFIDPERRQQVSLRADQEE
jgi:hypothetical protein